MTALIWTGAALTLAGILGLGICIQRGLALKKAGLDDAALRQALQKLVTLNLASLGASALGLMLVIAGIMLG